MRVVRLGPGADQRGLMTAPSAVGILHFDEPIRRAPHRLAIAIAEFDDAGRQADEDLARVERRRNVVTRAHRTGPKRTARILNRDEPVEHAPRALSVARVAAHPRVRDQRRNDVPRRFGVRRAPTGKQAEVLSDAAVLRLRKILCAGEPRAAQLDRRLEPGIGLRPVRKVGD